jgi:CHAT domain-containing protein
MTGPLTSVPIHACSPKPTGSRKHRGLGMIDLVVSSYTPTISTLLQAQKKHNPSHHQVLAVALPEGGYRQDPLLCALSEVEAVQHGLPMFQQRILVGVDATINGVVGALSSCTWAHFACHGLQDPDKPMDSAFVVQDGFLSLAKIAQSLSPNAQFAFLCACQTAKGSNILPNESLHMAAGLQFAGFKSVVGTMWSINDNDGLFIAEKFYQHVIRGNSLPQPSDAAYALHQAVQDLCKEKNVPAVCWVPFVHFGI